MIDNIIKFLQELGPGFTLAGKEYKWTTPAGKDFYIDLLMYHTKIHAYVVIEVKIGEFDPKDIGQLVFYVNAIDDLEKIDGDNDTIGLLLCKDADKYVAETTLKKNHLSLGISKYKLIEELPEYLERKLKEIKGWRNHPKYFKNYISNLLSPLIKSTSSVNLTAKSSISSLDNSSFSVISSWIYFAVK